MKNKGYYGRSKEHSLNARGITTRKQRIQRREKVSEKLDKILGKDYKYWNLYVKEGAIYVTIGAATAKGKLCGYWSYDEKKEPLYKKLKPHFKEVIPKSGASYHYVHLKLVPYKE